MLLATVATVGIAVLAADRRRNVLRAAEGEGADPRTGAFGTQWLAIDSGNGNGCRRRSRQP